MCDESPHFDGKYVELGRGWQIERRGEERGSPQKAQRPDLATFSDTSCAQDSGTLNNPLTANGSAPSFRSVGIMSVHTFWQARDSAVPPLSSTMFTSAFFSICMAMKSARPALWKNVFGGRRTDEIIKFIMVRILSSKYQ
jgi:hypothetical protein